MTPSQNLQSAFLRDTIYDFGSNWDSYHLLSLMKNPKPDDLGIIEYWSQTQQTATPLYTMASFGGKNTKLVYDPMGRYTWATPTVNDMPHITRDLDPSNTRKGVAGKPFRIALNRRAFSYTDIISYDKMSGLEMIVCSTEITSTGNGEFIYTVRLMNNNNTAYLDNKYLVPQTSFFRKSSAKAIDYGERYSEIHVRTGVRQYYNFVGDAVANVHYTISNKADQMMRASYNNKTGNIDLRNTGKQGIPVKEIWNIHDNDKRDPSIVNIPDAMQRLGQAGMIKAMEDGWITRGVVTSVEQACVTKLAEDVENYLMWGLGGRATADGPDMVRTTVGLWRQMDNAFKTVYNVGTFTPSIIENQIYNFFRGRVDLVGPDPDRKLIIQTGIAGMRQMNEAIKNMAINSGLVINASDVGAISRKGLDLDYGYAYTSYTIPFLANVRFVVNPALDPILANDIENPWVNGFRLSSYCYIVWDITDNPEDNIFLMKKASDVDDFKYWYVNGDTDYKGTTKGFAGTGLFSGYKVYFTMPHKAIQVIDNTKMLKIVPFNQVTRLPFGG